ncbi:MAG: type II toxin-antitoxin system HicB family antitoxin [Bacteroidetes bacterium]|nr:type II toxin-antitoxin system HicB family antitoxin [Bacteroidota bacterium]
MRKYLIILEKSKTGYSAYVPDLPGCAATGTTKSQVEKLIYDAIEFHLEGLKEFKQPIPKSETEAYSVLVPVR